MRISELVMGYEAPIRLGFFFGIFAFMAGWELLAPRRVLNVSKAMRWANNLGIVVLNTVLLRFLFPAAAVGIALFAREQGWGLLNYFQLPYGIASGEGAALASQLAPEGESLAVLDALHNTGTVVLASAPLHGGRVIGRVPSFVAEALPEASTDAQRCLQFARSSQAVTCAVVGMREPDHIDENLALTQHPPADPSVPAALFQRAGDESSRAG